MGWFNCGRCFRKLITKKCFISQECTSPCCAPQKRLPSSPQKRLHSFLSYGQCGNVYDFLTRFEHRSSQVLVLFPMLQYIRALLQNELLQVPLKFTGATLGAGIRDKKGPIRRPLQKHSAAAISQSTVPGAISSIKSSPPLAEGTPLTWKPWEHFLNLTYDLYIT